MDNIFQIRILFMGTPAFACAPFQQLIDDHYNIIGLVSQPDKPVGRKKELKPTPTKEIALAHNIPVYQPLSIMEEYSMILNLNPELIITCAYGQKVPTQILDYPKYGCINLHGSLLPKYRGGAPIQRALINGDQQTGMTLMQMIDRMDAGLMYEKEVVEIDINDTYDSLCIKLMQASKNLIHTALPKYLKGEYKGEVQDESKKTLAFTIKKEEEFVSFKKEEAYTLYNHMRGLISNPAPYAILNNGKKVKFFKISYQQSVHDNESGTIILEHDHFKVAALNGYIHVHECQMEGKSRMNAKDFINGIRNKLNELNFE